MATHHTYIYKSRLFSYLTRWYFTDAPFDILKGVQAYIQALATVYSFTFLLKTMFAPWKNQLYAYPEKGFDIQIVLQIWGANIVARLVGAMVRSGVIFTGLILQALVLVVGASILFLWVAFPVVIIALIIVSL